MTEQLIETNKSQLPDKKKSGQSVFIIVLLAIVLIGASLLIAMRAGLVSPPSWLIKVIPGPAATLVYQGVGLDSEEAKLAMMIESGRSGVCTIINKDNRNDVTKYYIDGEKMKIVSSYDDDGKLITSYIINDGEYSYMWEEGSNEGIKIKSLTKQEQQDIQKKYTDAMDDYELDLSEFVDEDWEDENSFEVSCQFMRLSSDEFMPPANVKFIDMAKQSEMMMGEMDEYDFGDSEKIMEMDLDELESWAEEIEKKYGDL